jgi:DNA-binding transcriptional LysR family regulator
MFEELLSRRGISFDRLRTLVDVAEAGSMAKAAEGDSNPQSQFSRQLKELEAFFETELTQRQGKNLKLTAEGLRLAEIARETLHSLNDFDAEIHARPITVTVGAGDSILHWLLLPRLGRLQTKLPQTRIFLRNCRTRDIVSGLNDLTLDLGLVRETGISSRHKRTRLTKLDYSIFVPKKLLSAKPDVDSRWILENVPLAVQASTGSFEKALEEAAEQLSIKLNIRLGCESFPHACRAVLSGYYAAILPSIAAAELDDKNYARYPAPLLKTQERTICVAWNPRLIRTRPEFERIIQCFSECLSK